MPRFRKLVEEKTYEKRQERLLKNAIIQDQLDEDAFYRNRDTEIMLRYLGYYDPENYPETDMGDAFDRWHRDEYPDWL